MTYNPRDPNGYGSGVSYANGGDPNLTVLYGVDYVMDSLIVRITTAWLWYTQGEFGYDVTKLVNAMTSQSAQQIAVRCQQEIMKDERVTKCAVTGTMDANGNLQIRLSVTLSGREQFNLIGTPISQLNVSQLQFTAQALN